MPKGSTSVYRVSIFVLCGLVTVLFLAPSVFAQSGAIKGKVRNQRGNGIPNAEIAVRQDGKVIKTVRTNSKGDFVMTGLRAGKYNISFDADGYSTGILYNIEVANKTRDLGSRLILGVDRGTLVLIRGSVFFREGASLTGAKVDLEIVNADGSSKRVDSAYTNTSGEVVFRRPPGTGKYRLTARFKGVSDSKEIDVDGPAQYSTAITLDISRNER